MRGADHSPESCFPLSDCWIPNGRRIYSRFEQLLGELKGFRGIPDVDRNDRGLAHLELKSSLFQLTLKEFSVGPELFHQPLPFRRIQQRKSRLTSRRGRGRVRSGKKKRPRAQIQKVDQVA